MVFAKLTQTETDGIATRDKRRRISASTGRLVIEAEVVEIVDRADGRGMGRTRLTETSLKSGSLMYVIRDAIYSAIPA